MSMKPRKERPEYKLGLRYLQEHGPQTAEELAQLLGIARRNTSHYLKLWRQEGAVRIVRYLRREIRGKAASGEYTPVYGLVEYQYQRDAVRPSAKDSKERSRRYRYLHQAVVNARNRARRGSEVKLFSQLRKPRMNQNGIEKTDMGKSHSKRTDNERVV